MPAEIEVTSASAGGGLPEITPDRPRDASSGILDAGSNVMSADSAMIDALVDRGIEGDDGGATAYDMGDTGIAADARDTGALDDGRILGVLSVFHAGQAEAGIQALTRGTDDRVVAYGLQMFAIHQNAYRQLGDLGIELVESDLAASARAGRAHIQRALQTQPDGSAFDRAYVELEIEAHRGMLRIIDSVLTPEVSLPTVADELAITRASIDAHLRAALSLRAALRTETDTTRASARCGAGEPSREAGAAAIGRTPAGALDDCPSALGMAGPAN